MRLRAQVRELEAKVDLLLERQHQVLALLTAMSKQQGLPFKRQKNPRRQEAGRRAYAKRLKAEQEAAQANGLLGLVDRQPETSGEG